jgi:hypothetical protein
MKRFYLTALLLLIVVAQPSPALSSMRCGNDLVGLGDHPIEVRAKCGEPAYVDERIVYHVKKIDRKHPHARRAVHVQKETHVPVSIETWVYNFGPNRFMREVWFVDGRLGEIRTLGRGFSETR